MNITSQIASVVNTFQQGRKLAESEKNLDALQAQLDAISIRYRSVAYEGASMEIALTQPWQVWQQFAQESPLHATQVHIGLGWALAQTASAAAVEPHSPSTYAIPNLTSALSQVDTAYVVKVLDGLGYWHGLFQRRQTIRTQQVPVFITEAHQSGFDQGVGRAMWYIVKGDVTKVARIIAHFAEERRPDLWQGIGVACIYVGGCPQNMIAEIKQAASPYHNQVENGMRSAKESMRIAGI